MIGDFYFPPVDLDTLIEDYRHYLAFREMRGEIRSSSAAFYLHRISAWRGSRGNGRLPTSDETNAVTEPSVIRMLRWAGLFPAGATTTDVNTECLTDLQVEARVRYRQLALERASLKLMPFAGVRTSSIDEQADEPTIREANS